MKVNLCRLILLGDKSSELQMMIARIHIRQISVKLANNDDERTLQVLREIFHVLRVIAVGRFMNKEGKLFNGFPVVLAELIQSLMFSSTFSLFRFRCPHF